MLYKDFGTMDELNLFLEWPHYVTVSIEQVGTKFRLAYFEE